MLRLAVLLFAVLAAPACWRTFIFHPTRLPAGALELLAAEPGWKLDRVRVEPDIELVGLVRPPPDEAAPWLLYFGGNAMGVADAQEVLTIAADKEPWGLASWAYRGYDGSDGAPSEEALVEDAVYLARHLLETYGVAPERLFLVGQSLGTGVAALAAKELVGGGVRPAGLALLAPYTSMAEVVNEKTPIFPVAWSVSDEFPSEEALVAVDLPVLIIHGVHDEIISIAHGRRLHEVLGARATLVEVNRGHNDLWVAPSPATGPLHRFIAAHALEPAARAP
jgi:uncharacterized protein